VPTRAELQRIGGRPPVAAIAEQMAREGAQVRFLRSIFVPGDEICFLLFTGPSAEAVAEVVRRASIKRVPGAPWPLSDRPGLGGTATTTRQRPANEIAQTYAASSAP